MNGYEKTLKSVVNWILTILLVGILCTSVLIYPPYAFISYRSPNEKVIMIQNLTVPCIVILICTLLEYFRKKKNIIFIAITLIFNITAGLTIKLFDITHISYIIANVNFFLVPICFAVMLKSKIKPPKILFYVFFAIQILLCSGLIVTAVIGSYVFVLGLMYFSLPMMINVNVIACLNDNIIKLKIIVFMYLFNLVFIAYNIFWY